MKNIILVLLTVLPSFLSAQALEEDFSDGDFTDNLTWSGHTDRFIVNAEQQLQLFHEEAEGTTNSYLSVPAATSGLTVWEFFIRQEFSPSASNHARVYLRSDVPDLTGEVNGYFVQIGGVSGNMDAVELKRQDGSATEVLISGAAGGAANDPTAIRVRVEVNASGNWVLLTDYAGGTEFSSEGGATDTTYDTGAYFGWRCRYTATRNTAFFLDDVFIEPLFTDTNPPELLSAAAENAETILLNFNEPLSDFTAANFSVDNDITVLAAEADPVNAALIRLTVSPALQNFTTYTVTVQNVADAEGNVLAFATADFDFLQAQTVEPGDIIINEIMADPTPVRSLPDAEFAEIFNRSEKVIDLGTLRFVSDDSPDALTSVLLLPGEYAIICDDEFADDFAVYGKVAPVSSMPALSNGGDLAGIEDADGTVIDAVNYDDSWYNDDEKADGGWTLERIGANAPSECAGNWRASEDTRGGTPGAQNSVNGQFTDTDAPLLVSVVPQDAFSVTVTFSEGTDVNELREELNYTLDNGLTVLSANPQNAQNTSVQLLLSDELQSGTIYTLTVSNAIGDCLGNMTAADQSKIFGLAETPEPLDIVINEILFNPRTGGSDYVEFYNRSSKIFNFNGFVDAPVLILPGEYIVVTEEPQNILEEYTVESPQNLFLGDLPSYPNDSGTVVLTLAGITVDSFTYSEDMHYQLLRSEDGVALERIDPDAPTNSAANWHSAAATTGYGTPTAPNSQLMPSENVPPAADFFSIENPRVSPDEDGFEDVVIIDYTLDGPGYTGSAHIYDARGRLIKSLINNELLEFSGSLKWDGSTDDLAKARVGIYVFWAEIFRPDGTVVQEKEVITVAGSLD